MMPNLLLETSWEVCNKVGGIYAVLSTKAKTLQKINKDKTVFIGPDLWAEKESPYFEQSDTLLAQWHAEADLPRGVVVRVGRWTVPGTPIAVLVNYKSLFDNKDALYKMMWDEYHVDSLHAYGDYDESCMFAYGAALVMKSLAEYFGKGKRVVAHFDEWTVGMGLLYLKSMAPQIATVFTTHATSIGRSICGNGKPLYDYMSGYNGDQMAGELNMQSKHSLEKAAAHQADAFTTVSDVTAAECRQLLEIDPIVTPNAFEQGFVPKGAIYNQRRKKARRRILDVAFYMTGQRFDDDTLLVLTSGRHEYRNKGLDAYIDAINVAKTALNGQKRKVVAFIMVPGWTKESRSDLRCGMITFHANPHGDALITHELYNYGEDAVYQKMVGAGFDNRSDENVKLVYVPCYLDGHDEIFDISYYDLLPAFDLSIFASYYEPWGYTPLESAAFGVPTVTTDLAGFGQWVISNYTNADCGVNVVHRNDSNYDELVHTIADHLAEFYAMPADKVTALRKAAAATAKAASWDNFIKYYQHAYAVAMDSAAKREKNL